MNRKALLAEFVGTLALVFIAMGVHASYQLTGGATGLIGIALAEGFIVAVMVSLTATVSGGHLNPAVTVGALVGKRIELFEALTHLFAQCFGAIVAAFVITVVLPAEVLDPIGMGIPSLGANVSVSQGFIMEVVLTFFLVFVFFASVVSKRSSSANSASGGLLVGLTYASGVLVAGPVTGAAMNPALYTGPALLAGDLTLAWLYWLAPMVGGILAGYIYTQFIEDYD